MRRQVVVGTYTHPRTLDGEWQQNQREAYGGNAHRGWCSVEGRGDRERGVGDVALHSHILGPTLLLRT